MNTPHTTFMPFVAADAYIIASTAFYCGGHWISGSLMVVLVVLEIYGAALRGASR